MRVHENCLACLTNEEIAAHKNKLMTLMVAYYLTFEIMLTFLDHSRIWYDGVFFINKHCFGHAKSSCHDPYLRVD